MLACERSSSMVRNFDGTEGGNRHVVRIGDVAVGVQSPAVPQMHPLRDWAMAVRDVQDSRVALQRRLVQQLYWFARRIVQLKARGTSRRAQTAAHAGEAHAQM